MSEANDTMSRRGSGRNVLAPIALLVALVALWVIPMFVAPQVGQERFPGADAQATEMVEDTGYQPWFAPVFEPSGEVESGIFALQAALGAGVLFYVIGFFHGRSRAERTRSDSEH